MGQEEMSRHDVHIQLTERHIAQIVDQLDRTRRNLALIQALGLDWSAEEHIIVALELSLSCLLAHRNFILRQATRFDSLGGTSSSNSGSPTLVSPPASYTAKTRHP